MRIKILSAVTIIVVLVSSCKKSEIKPNGISISKAIDSGVLFATWLINDEDPKKQDQTQASKFFADKISPEITFYKHGYYIMKYTSGTKSISERGSWTTDTGSNTLILKDTISNKENSFLINQLDEENFILTNVYTSIKIVTNSEGATVNEEQTIKEMLYLEDND